MAGQGRSSAGRVAVVTGGAAGIGAAIAEELGRRGAMVVTADPGVAVDGAAGTGDTASTAQRILDAGGSARASTTSVTDRAALDELFHGLVEEFGSLDVVVNVAGITRMTQFAAGTEQDWAALVDVHLNGYRNVLAAALPLMTAAGHGTVLGVTSGGGWRAANTGAYSCAKRAVAALTWQLGRALPPGVTLNALSPIALTRMVTSALPKGMTLPPPGSSGGLSLGAMPPPGHLGPIGAHLVGEGFAWSSGEVIFSGGSEVSRVVPPRVLELARTADVADVGAALDTLVPEIFGPAEQIQGTSGGSNPRFGPIFDQRRAPAAPAGSAAPTCLVVTDDTELGGRFAETLQRGGARCVGVGAWKGSDHDLADIPHGFADVADAVARIAAGSGPVSGVVVCLSELRRSQVADAGWRHVLRSHDGVAERIVAEAAWMRAAADHSAATGRPVRVVSVVDGTDAGGRSAGQAVAQLTRGAHLIDSAEVDAFAVSVETTDPADRGPLAELVAHLVLAAASSALSGAELLVAEGCLGLRSHPHPDASISYGGPDVPGWLDGALRRVVGVNR